MSRTASLEQRLSALESTLLARVLAELEAEARGSHSMFFTRKLKHVADGKAYLDEGTAELERLERDVANLCAKLGGPAHSQALALVAEFTVRLESTEKPWTGGKVALARALLSQVKSNISLQLDRER
jgi:hypothetical protein